MDVNDLRSAVTVTLFLLFLAHRGLHLENEAQTRVRRGGDAAIRRRA